MGNKNHNIHTYLKTTKEKHIKCLVLTGSPVALETIAGPRSPMITTCAISVPSWSPIILQTNSSITALLIDIEQCV